MHTDSAGGRAPRLLVWAAVVFCLLALAACRQRMAETGRDRPLDASTFFPDGRSSRPLVPGTVARGELRADQVFYTGKSGETLVDALPFPLTREVLERGRERFEIFCSPCHGRVGTGDGMVVRRGLRPPPSFHIERLRAAPLGHFFDVMTNGLGVMSDYAAQVRPRDRWAIAAYIRALQFSQAAALADLTPAERQRLETPGR